jgi:predicted ATPase
MTAGSHALLLCGERERMLSHCDEVEQVVIEEGLGPFAQNVLVGQWRGMAHILGGDFPTGYRLMKQGNDFWNQSDGHICNALFWSWLSMGLGGMGQIPEALALIDGAIAHCRQTGDCYMEPECLRIRGELLLQADEPDRAVAEAVLREAVRLAQVHKAKSWELRAATSLAKLWRSSRREAEALDLLLPIHEWFTEGFDTPDLRQARNLLEELS